jgi:hypothetical protein
MRVHCPAGARPRVERVVRVDGTYEDFAGDAAVRPDHVDGIRDAEGVIRVASEDGTTLVFNDILFNMPHLGGLGGLFVRFIGSSGGPRVSRTGRFFLLRDARALARDASSPSPPRRTSSASWSPTTRRSPTIRPGR